MYEDSTIGPRGNRGSDIPSPWAKAIDAQRILDADREAMIEHLLLVSARVWIAAYAMNTAHEDINEARFITAARKAYRSIQDPATTGLEAARRRVELGGGA